MLFDDQLEHTEEVVDQTVGVELDRRHDLLEPPLDQRDHDLGNDGAERLDAHIGA